MYKSAQRVLLEALIGQSLRGFQDSPHRELRKLVDLGETLAKSPAQQTLFHLAQGCIQQEDSPYFELFGALAQNVRAQAIKELGLNVGYESWVRGAQLIQSLEAERGHHIPWTLVFEADTAQAPMPASRLGGVLAQARQLGLHTFFFHLAPGGAAASALLPQIEEFSDCAFFLLCAPEKLTPALADRLAALPNAMVFLSAQQPAAAQTAAAQLQKQRSLYGLWLPYRAALSPSQLTQFTGLVAQLEAPLALLAAEPGCPVPEVRQMGQAVKQLRAYPQHPVFPIELACDLVQVDSIISGQGQLAQLWPSGQMAFNGCPAPFTLDGHTLRAVLSSVPPAQ